MSEGGRPKVRCPVAALAALLVFVPALADDARQLLEASEARHRSQSQEYAGQLEVVSAAGKVRRKAWRSWRQGYGGDARSLIRFTDPPEVRGVGFLSVGRPGKNPDQWLYLPSMKRERRVAPQDRHASFVGTDFSYEDMEDFDHTKWEVRLEGEEPCDGEVCHVIQARPKDTSVYGRKQLWLRRDLLLVVRVDSFRKGSKEPWKRLVLSDIALVDGHWAARKLEMTDLAKGSRTTVLLDSLVFDRPQPPDRFTLLNLNREGGE